MTAHVFEFLKMFRVYVLFVIRPGGIQYKNSDSDINKLINALLSSHENKNQEMQSRALVRPL